MKNNSNKRIVVKIGSSSISNTKGGLSQERLAMHSSSIAELINCGHQVVLVSSGAISAGFKKVGYPGRPTNTVAKQAAAALGQGILMQSYSDTFKKDGILIAQILLTRRDFAHRESYNNAINTITELLKRRILPIINENDTVAIDELTFGDNDMLAALVATLLHADLLITLSTIDGLYSSNPNKSTASQLYEYLPEITNELLDGISDKKSSLGTGGMRSKIAAARLALSMGVPSYIGKLHRKEDLCQVILGQAKGTYIGARGTACLDRKRQWIAFHSEPTGKIVLDSGAIKALLYNNKSLLPAGVKEVYGNFEEGAVIEVIDNAGELIGKGIVNYSAEILRQACGQSTEFVKNELKITRPEVIHRNNWVTLATNLVSD